jgi:hypothetical protein
MSYTALLRSYHERGRIVTCSQYDSQTRPGAKAHKCTMPAHGAHGHITGPLRHEKAPAGLGQHGPWLLR